jgi:hypothetical protein
MADTLRPDNRLSLTYLPGEPQVAAAAGAEEAVS